MMTALDGPLGALILFGPPGSGKGTQAQLLRDRLSIPHISTGDMLRDRIAARDPLGLQLVEAINTGKLVPDDMVNEMVDARTAEPDCATGFILDGYPRTLSQWDVIRKRLIERGMGWVVVHLKLDLADILVRLGGRRHCPRCGSLYNVHSSPPKVVGVCDNDGERLATRPDDQESVIRRRLWEYEAQTRPLLDALAGGAREFHEIDAAARTPDALAAGISELVRWNGAGSTIAAAR